jgi:hypothetical protein
MKRTSFPSSITVALAIGLATLAMPGKIEAQQTASDRFDISLSHPVTIGNKVLQPGNYSIEPVTIAGGDAPAVSISMINADNGRMFETTTMIVPTAQTGIQPETRVLLRHVGHSYYFERIWVKGLMYGYDFPLPKGVKGRGREVQ